MDSMDKHETTSVCACAHRQGAHPARGWLTLVGGGGLPRVMR